MLLVDDKRHLLLAICLHSPLLPLKCSFCLAHGSVIDRVQYQEKVICTLNLVKCQQKNAENENGIRTDRADTVVIFVPHQGRCKKSLAVLSTSSAWIESLPWLFPSPSWCWCRLTGLHLETYQSSWMRRKSCRKGYTHLRVIHYKSPFLDDVYGCHVPCILQVLHNNCQESDIQLLNRDKHGP